MKLTATQALLDAYPQLAIEGVQVGDDLELTMVTNKINGPNPQTADGDDPPPTDPPNPPGGNSPDKPPIIP